MLKGYSSRTSTYLLIAILVVGAALRFHQVDQPFVDAFSWRQSSTAMMAENFYRRNWNIFYPEVNWTGPGPNYQGREFQTISYLSALLYTVLGQQDWVGRTVAILFGLWGIFALYQLVRRVWSVEHGLVSAAVLALLPGSIFIERSFLPDAAMTALVTTGVWLLICYLQDDRPRDLWFASLITAWGFLSKLPGLVIGLPMLYVIWTILWQKRQLYRHKLTQIGIAAILTLLPVVAYYLWARHLSLSYPPYHFAGSGNWLWDSGWQRWWQEGYFLPSLYRILKSWLWTWPVMILVLVGFLLPPPSGRLGFTWAEQRYRAPWLFHGWMLAMGIYYLIGAKELVGNPWNLHLVNPAAAALAAHGIVAIASVIGIGLQGSQLRRRSSAAFLGTVIVLLLLIGGFSQRNLASMYYPYAQAGQQLGLALRQVSQPGDLAVTLANDLGDPVALYYSRRRGWVFPPAQPDRAWGHQLPEDDREAIALLTDLQAQGADWLGMVNEHRQEIERQHPQLATYIKRVYTFEQASPEWTIYRISTPQPPSGRP